ncbi:hypothetical protein JOQ06_012885, partial [Pogonophryne albipinna]
RPVLSSGITAAERRNEGKRSLKGTRRGALIDVANPSLSRLLSCKMAELREQQLLFLGLQGRFLRGTDKAWPAADGNWIA